MVGQSQNVSDSFQWVEETSQFNEDFTKDIMKIVMKDIFLNWMFNILKYYMTFRMINPFS